MFNTSWPAFEPRKRSIPAYLKDARFRQMFTDVTNVDGLGRVPVERIRVARAEATSLVTDSAEFYTERYGVRWAFSTTPPFDDASEAEAMAVCQRDKILPVSDASIRDHIFLTDEAEGSYQFWRAISRHASSVPFGPVGECLLSLRFMDRLLGGKVSKDSVLARLLEAQFWADSFRVETGHDVRDRLAFAHMCIGLGPQQAVVAELQTAVSTRS